MGRAWLYARLALAIAFMFAILYGLLVLIAYIAGFAYPIFLAFLAFIIILLQYLISPKIVEVTMRVKYIEKKDMPKLYGIVEKLAMEANIPIPRVGIALSLIHI